MAVTSAQVGMTMEGNKKIRWGKLTTSSTEQTGEIETGSYFNDLVFLTPVKATQPTTYSSIDETMPVGSVLVTADFEASADMLWFAVCRR